MKLSNENRIRLYFEKEHGDFDASYAEQGRGIKDIIRKIAYPFNKKAIEGRLNALLELVGTEVSGKRILEVGCGPGLYSINLAKKGADVTATDYSAGMIEAAGRNAAKAGAKIRFETGDFLNIKLGGGFYYTFATGVIEYIDPSAHKAFLNKMAELSNQYVIVSFPKRNTIHAAARSMWLMLFKKIKISFFSKKDILRLASECDLEPVDWRDVGILRVVKFKKVV